MRTQVSLPVRPHYSIATSMWYCVNADHGFEAGPFLSEEEAKDFAARFNAEHKTFVRSLGDPSDQLESFVRLTEEEANCDDPTQWPPWTDGIVIGDGAPLCAAELLPGTWPLIATEENV